MARTRPVLLRSTLGWFATALTACAPAAGGGDHQGDGAVDARPEDPADSAADNGGPDASDAPDAAPTALGAAPRFGFPIDPADRARIHPGLFFGVDHDPVDGDAIDCLAYDGRHFPFCYDGHEGSDFVLDGGFTAMDAGSAQVVAAAGGIVVEAVDGNYDRCSGDLQDFEPTCDGHPIRANKVVIEHALGWRSRYLHLMQGSVAVEVGDRVPCGTPLGRVGSSGRSYTPHLHFEVLDADGAVVDPFAGEVSGARSLWVEQRAADDLPGASCDPAWGPVP